jgi:[ribosomal protein S5]-alanine N-acetyltransferase
MEGREEILETKRMILSKLILDDLNDMEKIHGDAQAMKFYPKVLNREETVEWIQRQMDRYEKQGFALWACHLKDTKEFVGQCGLHLWDDVDGCQELEVGYLFVPKFWKQGLATEAAKACEGYASKTLGYRRLISLIRPGNTASRKVAEKNGLKVEKETVFHGYETLVYSKEI